MTIRGLLELVGINCNGPITVDGEVVDEMPVEHMHGQHGKHTHSDEDYAQHQQPIINEVVVLTGKIDPPVTYSFPVATPASPEELGQVAYEAYCDEISWTSVRGEPLPQWDDQQSRLKVAWQKAAIAVVRKAIE